MNAVTTTRPRVLVIDDTRSIHEDFRKILTVVPSAAPEMDSLVSAIFGTPAPLAPAPLSFDLDCASQGQTGFALLQDAFAEGRPYSLAFVDMRMPPGWDGLETIRHLWAADPTLQVVICTAYSDHSWATINERLGYSDNLLILKKPFDSVELLQVAHAMTGKWRLAREKAECEARLEELLKARGVAA